MMTTSIRKSPVASRKKYPAPKRPSIEELKKKYESNAVANQETPKHPPQLSTLKMLKKYKVKQIASMFNSNISQILRPEPKPQPKASLPKPLSVSKIRYNKEKAPIPSPRTKSKKSMFFVSEDNFAKLTVKDKVQLYTQFIDDMSKKNPMFGKHAELMEANVKKVVSRGEVVNEKQESVKRLLEELEARCAFPRQTISPLALQRMNSVKEGMKKTKLLNKCPVKSKEFEDILEKKVSHITTLTVTLQPTVDVKKQRRSRSLPRRRRDHDQLLKELCIIEPSYKRNNDEMRSSLPIEAYAPPKKIRHLTAEKLAPQIIFRNQQLENLFFAWLRERQEKEEEQNIKEEVKPKSAIDNLLGKAVAKMKTVETLVVKEKEVDTTDKKTENSASRRKKPAPPVPVQSNKITVHTETSTNSSVIHTEAEESESGLSSLPKITSEESQADTYEKESENSEKDPDLGKPIKPLRKKKIRRNLTSKKDAPIEETHPKTSTDSDSDSKITETKTKNKMLYIQPQTEEVPLAVEFTQPEPSFVGLDKSLMREANSPRNIESSYTLTTSSPIPSQQKEGNHNDLDFSECDKSETSCSWPSLVDNQIEQDLSVDNKALSSDSSSTLPNIEPRSLADSFIDQGFETGSNDTDSPIRAPKRSVLKRQDATKVAGSLFSKGGTDTRRVSIDPVCNLAENPSGFSTPIKGHLQQPAQQQLFSPITMPLKTRRRSTYDTESRRNSLAMQVIREDHPLEHHETISPRNLNTTQQAFFANATTLDGTADMSGRNPNQTSQFWIKCGDFTVSLDIYYNDNERVRLLYEIFSQRSCDTKDLHFGIDYQKFSVHNSHDKENMSSRLPANKGSSHYWFSTGNLVIPFSGKRLPAEKVQHLFQFIKSSVEETGILRFGVDAVEFSSAPEFWNQSPKFSMESNYSMLVGLQTGNSNGLEGRSKYAWPNTKPVRVSDLDQSDYECEDFEDNDSCRISFSPFSNNHFNLATLGTKELSMPRNSEAMMSSESFDFEYENESLDHLFEDKYNTEQMPNIEQQPLGENAPVPNMLSSLKTEQIRLNLNYLRGAPKYISTLKSILAKITSSSGDFKDCTVQQLEDYIFFLSHCTAICRHDCSDHKQKVLDALLCHTDKYGGLSTN